jgi:uncharacterized protein (DUF433 family)
MSTAIDIGSLITASDDVRGGRPRIAKTGVTVQRVVRWYRLGLTPEEIADRIGHLNLAQVHAALSYYHANRPQTDAEIAADDREDERAMSLTRNGAEPKP